MSADTGPVRTPVTEVMERRPTSWTTTVGVVVMVVVVTGALVLAGRSSGTTPHRTGAGAPAVVPSAAASGSAAAAPTTTTAASSATAAASSATAAAGGATTTAGAATTTVATPGGGPDAAPIDLDGDGRPDAVTTHFLTKHTAEVVVRLATGKSLTSKAFPLYHEVEAGRVFGHDVDGDGRDELLVSDPGADGNGYELFTLVGGALVEVPAPTGQQQPFLYIGGGMYYSSSFGCSAGHLVQAQEKPAVADTASLPPDPAFTVTTTTWTLHAGRLAEVGHTTVHAADRAAASRTLQVPGNGCGTSP